MLTDEKKKHIESLSTDEMLYEINLGRRSRFQREKFAYLKTTYEKRMSYPIGNNHNTNTKNNVNDVYPTEIQHTTTNKTVNKSDKEHYSVEILPTKSISLIKIAERVIAGFFILLLGWICLHYFYLDLKP